MQVITYNHKLLESAIDCLASKIRRGEGKLTYIVAIMQGGAYIGRSFRFYFPEAQYHEITISRPSRIKGKLFRWMVQNLPQWLLDQLRKLELKMQQLKRNVAEPQRIGEVDLEISPKPGDIILLLDDAIDTGATINKARKQILEKYPDVKIRIACITMTTDAPICEADYTLYHNQTLCRFPWSLDYHSKE